MYTGQCIEYNAQNTMHCIMKHRIHWQKYNAYETIYRLQCTEYKTKGTMPRI